MAGSPLTAGRRRPAPGNRHMASSGKPPQDRAAARKLKKTRHEAKDFLKEVRRLVKRHGKKLDESALGQVQEGATALEASLGVDDVGRLGAALKRLDGLVEKHLGFARLSPSVEYAISIGKALAIALVLRLFVVEAFRIPSGSMIPTLLIGDQLFVNKLSYGLRLPVVNRNLVEWGGHRRGDVVVFSDPRQDMLPLLDRQDLIKRVVGLPGEVIEVRDEVLFVDGEAQPRELLDPAFQYFDRTEDGGEWWGREAVLMRERLANPGAEPYFHRVLRDPDRVHLPLEGPFQVPPGHLFMMGDNRDNSADGRYGGWFVPFGHVKGRAIIVWLSWGKPGLWLWGETGFRFGRMFRSVH